MTDIIAPRDFFFFYATCKRKACIVARSERDRNDHQAGFQVYQSWDSHCGDDDGDDDGTEAWDCVKTGKNNSQVTSTCSFKGLKPLFVLRNKSSSGVSRKVFNPLLTFSQNNDASELLKAGCD